MTSCGAGSVLGALAQRRGERHATTGDQHGGRAGPTIQEQTGQALANCRAVLEAGGATLDDVVEGGVLLTHSSDFVGMDEEYANWFPEAPPTRYIARLGVDLPACQSPSG